MILHSQFTQWFATTGRKLPKREREAIRREAIARVKDRAQVDVARSPLDFADLVARGEETLIK